MLNAEGFDRWTEQYDDATCASDNDNTYPFAGYRKTLKEVADRTLSSEAASLSVLDIGFGTGILTRYLYEQGCRITGVDFSRNMLDAAQCKMPDARLICHDFTCGLPESLCCESYDRIISTYALHHLTDSARADFLHGLLSRLKPGGLLIIGDIAFADAASLAACRNACGDGWDDEECYFLCDDMRRLFAGRIQFTRTSFCAGVFTIWCDTDCEKRSIT